MHAYYFFGDDLLLKPMKNPTIPSEFYSFETKAPFENCIECNRYLLDEDVEYLIEKAFKNYAGYDAKDVVFDYAICMPCAEKMRDDISKESMECMMNYFKENLDVAKRLSRLDMDPTEMFNSCLIKNKRVDDCREYQVFAHCVGKELNLKNPPYMISGEVMEELISLLSEKTIDEMNGFFKRHFSPDPSFFEPTPKLILV